MQEEKENKNRLHFLRFKANPFFALLGGILGLIAATVVLYLVAVSGEYDPYLIVFTLFPLGGIVWFSTLDSKRKSRSTSSDQTWDFGRSERVSKFKQTELNLDAFGIVLSIIFAYFSIYLSEVWNLTHAYLAEYPEADAFALFSDIFVNILSVDWASKYLWDYWLGLTIVLVILFFGVGLFSYFSKKSSTKLGRKLNDAEKAKLAYGAVLFSSNGLSYDYLLGLLPNGRIQIKDAKKMLLRDWEIRSGSDLQERVAHLLTINPDNDLDQLLKSIRDGQASAEEAAIYDDIAKNLMEHYQYREDELQSIQTLQAWNYDRLVNLVRYAYAAKYITEEEMWSYIDQAISQARSQYQTWRQYFAAIILGRSLAWGGTFEHNRVVAMKLLNNPNSIYKQYPFK